MLARRSLGPTDELMPLSLTLRSRRGPIRINSGDFGVMRRCYGYADWIDRSRRFRDLGANEELFSPYALAANPVIRVTALEAQTSLCERLHANLHSNGWEQRARVICGLAGGSNRQLDALAETASGVVNMEALLAELGAVDFLKGDIEGSAFALFEDCGTWIGRVHYIAMEVPHGLWRQPGSPAPAGRSGAGGAPRGRTSRPGLSKAIGERSPMKYPEHQDIFRS